MSKFAAIVLLIILAFCAINGSGLCMLTQVIHQNYFSLRNKSHVMMTSQASRDNSLLLPLQCRRGISFPDLVAQVFPLLSRALVSPSLFTPVTGSLFCSVKGSNAHIWNQPFKTWNSPLRTKQILYQIWFFFLTLSSQSWQSRSQLVKVLALWSS